MSAEDGTRIAATGNGMKSHDLHDTFMTISGGSGNRGGQEVHVLIESNDGEYFAQSWFPLDEVLRAVEAARRM